MQSTKTELLELLRRNDLLRASLMIAKVQDAAFNIESYQERVMEIAARVFHRAPRHQDDPILLAEHVNFVLYKEMGLEGKSDRNKALVDDPSRYYLHNAVDRGACSPLTLTILYSIVADQVGLKHEVLSLPSYFLIKVQDVASDFYIDPFEGGRFLNQDEFQRKFRTALQRNRMASASLFEKLNATQLVTKLLQQLKQVYILKGNALEALRAVEVLTAFFPDSPELTRDRGILYCEVEYFTQAMKDLKSYLKARPNADDVAEIRKLTTMLRDYRDVVN